MSPGSTPLSHPPGTIAAGVQIVPEYCLESRLGKGGFGEVWKAIGPGRVAAALKIIVVKDSEAGEREFRSLDLLRELRHPNLLPIQGYWLLDDAGLVINDDRPPSTLVIAMLLGGKNLRQRLTECQNAGSTGIPPIELLEYMRDAAKGIDFLNRPVHKLGDRLVAIQHRDIKPQNLMIVGGGLMVADFGIAGVMEATRVHTESAAMTFAYAAPELFEHTASAWTDQYALAITYCHLRAGRLPFANSSSTMQIMAVHTQGTHDFSGLSSGEIEVVKRATARIPEKRFANCLEFVARLEVALQSADTAPTVMLTRGSSPSSGIPAIPVEAEHLKVTTDNSRIATLPVLPSDASRRLWVKGGTIAGVGVAIALALGFYAWQKGMFAPATLVVKPIENGGERPPFEKPNPPDRIEPKPTKEETLRAARKKAIDADQAGRYAEVAPALEPVFLAKEQNTGDYSLRGKARLALADKSDSPDVSYQDAADDFFKAGLPLEQSKALVGLGSWLLAHNRAKDAIAPLQLAIKSNPPDVPALQLQLCEAQLAAGELAAAIKMANDALRGLKVDDDANWRIAAQLHHAAARASLSLAAAMPTNPPADAPRVELEGQDQKTLLHFEEAVVFAEKVPLDELSTWKGELAAFHKLPRMIARQELRLAKERMIVLTKQLEKSPDDSPRLLELATLELKFGQDKQAAAHFGRGYSLQAIELTKNGKLEEAAKAAAQAAQYDADSAITQYAQAVVAIGMKHDQEALPFLDAAVARTPAGVADRWQMLATRGRALARIAAGAGTQQDWQRARTDFEAAIATYPEAAALMVPGPRTPAHRELALLHFERAGVLESLLALDAQLDPALLAQIDKSLGSAAALDADDPRFALAAGRSLLRQAHAVPLGEAAPFLEAASPFLSQALQRHPKLFAVHVAQGEYLLLTGELTAALASLEKGVELAEQEPVATRFQLNLDLCYAYLRPPRNDAKALVAAERAVALQAKDPDGHFARGLALRNLMRKPEAMAAFDEALTRQPKHVNSLLAKSQIILEADKSTQSQINQADKDIETAFAAAATDAQKGEAYYVRSLSSLKSHISPAADPAAAEPALIEAQRDLLQAVTLVPSNAIYAKAATDLFNYAAVTYTWTNAQHKTDNEKLQAEWKKRNR